MRDMLKPTLSLLVICFGVALCLALVNGLTRDTIALRMKSAAEEQRKQVMSEAKSFQAIKAWAGKKNGGTIREVYAAYDGPKLLGYVFGAFPKGYGGEMKVTVGVYSTGMISGVTVGENKETPGLGSKAAEAGFIGQFLSKTVNEGLRVVKQKPAAANEIEAISGATISSKAVTDAVSDSVELTANLIKNGAKK